MKLFDKYNIRTNWCIPGHTVDTFPQISQSIVGHGHEVVHHGYVQEDVTPFSYDMEDRGAWFATLGEIHDNFEEETNGKKSVFTGFLFEIRRMTMDFYRHENEKIGTIDNIYNGDMLPDLAINTFRNIERLFPTRTVPASSKPKPLDKSPLTLQPFKSQIKDKTTELADQNYDLYDYLAMNAVTGIVVLKEGKLVYENYLHGNGPDTRWMSMSVAKSITSTLVGVAIKDGYIESNDFVLSMSENVSSGISLLNSIIFTPVSIPVLA